MERQTLLLLQERTKEEHALVLQMLRTLLPDGKFSFSANAGEHGGFVTDDPETYQYWKSHLGLW